TWPAELPRETELSRQMTTSTTSIDVIGLLAAPAHLHTEQERDYFMQRAPHVISSSGRKPSSDVDLRPLLVTRSSPWASGSASAAVLRHAELGDKRHAHPVRDQDRAHDPVALQGNVRRVRHELTGIAFEEPGHVAAPLLLGSRVDAIRLLHVSLVHIHEELREA